MSPRTTDSLMGMFEQTDVTVKTKLILRGSEFLQELECVVWFWASLKSGLRTGKRQTVLLKGNHILGIRINLPTAH